MKILIINDLRTRIKLTVYQDGKDIETVLLDETMLHLLNQSRIELTRAHKIQAKNVLSF